MDSQYKLLSELLSDPAAFITFPKQVWQIIGGGHCHPCPPVSMGLPFPFDIFFVIAEICSSQFRCWSTSIPKYFACLIFETGSLPMTICKLCVSEYSMSITFFLPPKRRVCVVGTLWDTLFDSIQVFKQRRSKFTHLSMPGIVPEGNKMLV